jgi:hypothetical protein
MSIASSSLHSWKVLAKGVKLKEKNTLPVENATGTDYWLQRHPDWTSGSEGK